LRVLEERAVTRLGSTRSRPIDVRFLAATNRDLETESAAGRFRQDLYFRLAGITLTIPPLRERPAEVDALIRTFVAAACRQLDRILPLAVSPQAVDLLRAYPWPGNVRELRNALERAAIASDRGTVARQHLAADFGRTPATTNSGLGGIRFPIGTTVDAAERELILQTLAATSQNKTRAAELLGISLKTLHNKLKEYEAGRINASQPEN